MTPKRSYEVLGPYGREYAPTDPTLTPTPESAIVADFINGVYDKKGFFTFFITLKPRVESYTVCEP